MEMTQILRFIYSQMATRLMLEAGKREIDVEQLTQLYNRNGFLNKVKSMIGNTSTEEEEEVGGFCMMTMDLTGFKQVNDSLDHGIGDKVLMLIAEILRHSTSEFSGEGGVVLARLGGDEFAIFNQGCNVNDIKLLVGKILYFISNINIPITDDKRRVALDYLNEYEVTVKRGEVHVVDDHLQLLGTQPVGVRIGGVYMTPDEVVENWHDPKKLLDKPDALERHLKKLNRNNAATLSLPEGEIYEIENAQNPNQAVVNNVEDNSRIITVNHPEELIVEYFQLTYSVASWGDHKYMIDEEPLAKDSFLSKVGIDPDLIEHQLDLPFTTLHHNETDGITYTIYVPFTLNGNLDQRNLLFITYPFKISDMVFKTRDENTLDTQSSLFIVDHIHDIVLHCNETNFRSAGQISVSQLLSNQVLNNFRQHDYSSGGTQAVTVKASSLLANSYTLLGIDETHDVQITPAKMLIKPYLSGLKNDIAVKIPHLPVYVISI
jgi:diguanylate cyclase (GGDEF)-like protein